MKPSFVEKCWFESRVFSLKHLRLADFFQVQGRNLRDTFIRDQGVGLAVGSQWLPSGSLRLLARACCRNLASVLAETPGGTVAASTARHCGKLGSVCLGQTLCKNKITFGINSQNTLSV